MGSREVQMSKPKYQMNIKTNKNVKDQKINLNFGFWNLAFSCFLCLTTCILYLASCILFPCSVDAGAILSLDQIIENVQEVYDRTEDVQADFDQETRLKSWGQAQVAKGKVSFKKSGKMCWEYGTPMPQKFISDGEKVWVYIPQDRQVTVYAMNQGLQSEIASNLILGKGNLRKDFDITLAADLASGGKNYYRLQLKPLKPQANVEKIFLSVDKENFQVFETEIIDAFGNGNRIRFSHIKTNSHLPDSWFKFVVPEGVAVVTPQVPLSR
jgi:outer membrane lipoprotein carrier protein